MLFNYEGTFIQPELTLRRLKDYLGEDKYAGVTNRIKLALGLNESHELRFQKGGESLYLGRTRRTPFHSPRGRMDTE